VLVRVQFWALLIPRPLLLEEKGRKGFLLKEKGTRAEVVKLVDTHVSGACAARYAGSSPAFGTFKKPSDCWAFCI
jgi:hypothetical protein